MLPQGWKEDNQDLPTSMFSTMHFNTFPDISSYFLYSFSQLL